eukprot:TRINITY_DN33960_c0_g1_i1.p1 TRINITY_DN33960_c0_g1~~TRINITY_DN33960_c0_g1_i1.p1  ORF type:complete len:162 (-),score=15.79 TRINITY_DN33960_c0_g1_i1:430-915(-)
MVTCFSLACSRLRFRFPVFCFKPNMMLLAWFYHLLLIVSVTSGQQQSLITDWNHDLWRNKAFKRGDMVVVSGVTNLPDNSVLKCVAFDSDKDLFVLRDGNGKIWGVTAEKLRPLEEITLTDEWQVVPPGKSVPAGAEYRLDVKSGQNMARLRPKVGEAADL